MTKPKILVFISRTYAVAIEEIYHVQHSQIMNTQKAHMFELTAITNVLQSVITLCVFEFRIEIVSHCTNKNIKSHT